MFKIKSLATFIISIAAFFNTKAAIFTKTTNTNTTFHSTSNPVIKHKFTAGTGSMVYKDKVYLYTGHNVARPNKPDYEMYD